MWDLQKYENLGYISSKKTGIENHTLKMPVLTIFNKRLHHFCSPPENVEPLNNNTFLFCHISVNLFVSSISNST